MPYHRSEEHTSELQSRSDLVCRLLLEKKKNNCALDGTTTRLNCSPDVVSHAVSRVQTAALSRAHKIRERQLSTLPTEASGVLMFQAPGPTPTHHPPLQGRPAL